MSDQNQTNTVKPKSSTHNDDLAPSNVPTPKPKTPSDQVDTMAIMKDVANKVRDVHNILVALSSDPSVDEIAAAIGLSIYLDRTGKRATSIYSGKTPNALEFLRPDKTFETTSDILRDFVIALDKDKADHLRYKLDGDYVKIFITPYKSRINEEDLEFSLGDFNIELVLALNVASGIDLDDALREHGRVMHNATVVNVTNGNPGKFGDIEWSDKSKSSISEMAADLLYEIGGKNALMPDEATALLTGIVSATDHFSNNSTTADALEIGSRLMNSGADRELISENISLDSENMFFRNPKSDPSKENPSSLTISHDDTIDSSIVTSNENPNNSPTETIAPSSAEDTASADVPNLQAVAEDLIKSQAIITEESPSATTPTPSPEPTTETLQSEASPLEPLQPTASPDSSIPATSSLPSPQFELPSQPQTTPQTENTLATPTEQPSPSEPTETPPAETPPPTSNPETTIAPSENFATEDTDSSANKYGKMLEEALADLGNTPAVPTPTASVPPAPINPSTFPMPANPNISPTPSSTPTPNPSISSADSTNPAFSAAPTVATEPDINGIPDINYTAVSDDAILPPPPAPPIDFNSILPSSPTLPPAPSI